MQLENSRILYLVWANFFRVKEKKNLLGNNFFFNKITNYSQQSLWNKYNILGILIKFSANESV